LDKGEFYALMDALDTTVDCEVLIEDKALREKLKKLYLIECVEEKYCYKTLYFNTITIDKIYYLMYHKFMRLTNEIFIEKAKAIYGDLYDYRLVNYIDYKTKVKIICKIHGVFSKTPQAFLSRKTGCPICSKEKASKERSLGIDEFIKKGIAKFGTKYLYTKAVYKNTNTKLIITCKEHGDFSVAPKNFLRGSGCKECLKPVVNKEVIDHVRKLNIENNGAKNIFIPNRSLASSIANSPNRDLKSELIDFISSIAEYRVEDDIIYIEKHSIAFTIYNLHYHSEQQIGDKRFHLNKMLSYKEKGIRLIQIFEDEWIFKELIVKNRIKHFLGIYDVKIGGRKTIIKEIEASTKNEFLLNTHIQGVDRASIKLGAFYLNELVGVMTFVKPRVALGRKKKTEGEYELSRFSVKAGYLIMGLGSKMFQHFIKNYKVDTIFTFSDRRWNKGTFYTNIGMKKVDSTNVNYYYVVNGIRKHRFGYRKQELPKKLDYFDINITEYQNMLINGIDRIWDCGSDKFIYNV